MNIRTVLPITSLSAFLLPLVVLAQAAPSQTTPNPSTLLHETKPSESKTAFPAHIFEPATIEAKPMTSVPTRKPSIYPSKPKPPSRLVKTGFFVLGAGVYAAAVADMHQTLQIRHNYWWYETDPLARPFSRLPAPAYYATGLAMATGVNWLSWKMAHSRRWRKLAPIPQLLSISGNCYGFDSNHH